MIYYLPPEIPKIDKSQNKLYPWPWNLTWGFMCQNNFRFLNNFISHLNRKLNFISKLSSTPFWLVVPSYSPPICLKWKLSLKRSLKTNFQGVKSYLKHTFTWKCIVFVMFVSSVICSYLAHFRPQPSKLFPPKNSYTCPDTLPALKALLIFRKRNFLIFS